MPFSNILVVEAGRRIAVAAAGRLLADLGARVVVLDDSTDVGSLPLRVGKTSLTLSGEPDRDGPELARLMDAADVVLRSSDTPCSWDALVATPAGAIDCDITAFGAPLRSGPAWSEPLIQALAGLVDTTGPKGGTPGLSEVPAIEFAAGIYAAAAVAATLRTRAGGGPGQTVAVSLYDCAVNALATFLPLHFGGKQPSRAGNRHSMAAPWNAYKASDGWVLLCSSKDEHWQKLCAVMGRPELAAPDSPLARLPDRVARCDEVDAVVQAWAGTRTVEDCIAALASADIACGPIVPCDALPREPNLTLRGMIHERRDPRTGRTVRVAGLPIKSSAMPGLEPGGLPVPDDARPLLDTLSARPSATIPRAGTPQPLAGIRVLEIGQYTTAPLAARHLAALGAEVLKIEPPEGEASRDWPPHQDGQGYFFTLSNCDKRSVRVDLRTEEGIAAFRALVRSADVLVENTKPGSLARRGFGAADLLRLNPRLVYCGISGFGAESAYPLRPAFDTVVQAMCGIMDLTRVDGVPMKLGMSAADIAGGLLGLYAIIAALVQRDRTGAGQAIDLAMQDVGAWMTQLSWNGDASPTGEAALIPCVDGWVIAAAPRDALGDADPALSRTAAVERLRRRGILATPVRSVSEVATSDLLAARGLLTVVEDAAGRSWPLLQPPYRMSLAQPRARTPIGPIGEGNVDVLASLETA
ncbi:MAG TPA: CoA transferase [Azospirillum sp.]|nr:CoA transferase [Azospirillum sp.]